MVRASEQLLGTGTGVGVLWFDAKDRRVGSAERLPAEIRHLLIDCKHQEACCFLHAQLLRHYCDEILLRRQGRVIFYRCAPYVQQLLEHMCIAVEFADSYAQASRMLS